MRYPSRRHARVAALSDPSRSFRTTIEVLFFFLIVLALLMSDSGLLRAQEVPEMPEEAPVEQWEEYRQMLREHQRQKGEDYGGVGEDPSGRHEWFMFQRRFPMPYIPAGLRQRAIVETREVQAQLADAAVRSAEKGIAAAAAESRWENIGPYNIAGRVRAIVAQPGQANTIYVGAATGGVWKNTGDPDVWTSTFDTNSALSIGSLAFDPTNPSIIYAGTGEVINSHTSQFNATPAYFGDGVFKSTDGGVTWRNIGLDHLGTISDIHVMKGNPQVVYATSAQGGGGLFRSTDGGSTWIQQSGKGSFLGGAVFNIEVNPENESVILISTPNRIFYSADGGETFAVATGFTPSSGMRSEIAIAPSDPSRVYALVARASTDSDPRNIAEVYRSDDGGQSFQRIQTFPRDFFNAQGHYNNCIAVHPLHADTAYVGGIDIFRTENGGGTWSNRTLSYDGGNVHPDQHTMAFDPQNPNRMYLGNDGGVYISNDAGGSWSRISEGLPISQFYEIGVDQSRDFRVYGGTQDNGSLGGYGNAGWPRDWNDVLGGDGFHVIVDPSDTRLIYAESQYGSLWRINANNLGSRSYITSRMDYRSSSEYDPGPWSTPIAISELNGALYTGRQYLWQSFDRGNSWIRLNPGFGSSHSAIGLGVVNEGDILSGSSIGELAFSTDGGQNWQAADQTNRVPNRYISEIVYDPIDGNRVYVVASGFGGGGHVFRSDDRGATFTDITGNLPDIPTSALAIDPENNEYMWVGNDVGVFMSLDGGETWLPFNDGLPYVPVVDLEIHRSKRTLVAGTHGRSIFEVSIDNPQVTPIVLEPVGGAIYESGDSIPITWSGFLEPVRVLVSYDGGQTWDTVGVVTVGRATVVVAPFVKTDNAIIRVVTLDGTRDAVSNPFTVQPKANTDGRGTRGFRAGAIEIRNDRLWAADRDAAKFVLLRLPALLPTATSVSHSFDPGRILDLAYDIPNDRFFVLLGDTADFSDAEVWEMDPEGNTGAEIPLPVSSVVGIALSSEGLVIMTPGNDGVGYVLDPSNGNVIRQTGELSGAVGERRTGLVFDGTGYAQIVDGSEPGGDFPDAIERILLGENPSVDQSVRLIVEDDDQIDGFGLAFYGGDNELGEVVYYLTSTDGEFFIVTVPFASSVESGDYRAVDAGVRLSAIAPNPTTGRSTLQYTIDRPGTISVEVFDIDGNRVLPTIEKHSESGDGIIEVDLSGRPSGVYRAILTAPGGGRTAGTIVLLK